MMLHGIRLNCFEAVAGSPPPNYIAIVTKVGSWQVIAIDITIAEKLTLTTDYDYGLPVRQDSQP